MYTNPKNIKQEIKILFFYFVDLLIILGGFVVGVALSKALHLSFAPKMILLVITTLFAFWLCVRAPSHPKERNLSVLFHLFKMDRNHYHSIEIERKK
ncbi:DUF5592 family protein [Brochothrix thermosphacta]|uniref:DUF5592 family protein n=1 Tax=Brochothrix thermosphacta TaxID=2756 RepID=UPI00083F75A7|nr:DUF5592 family protein [Brochothrix thermosphacta]ANZ96204.1 hypothetical protein BFC19_12235 [Brochothrix thermosphacta]ODJ64896.1 hypothetical protein BFR36_09730 [Brochothrix thermosphacta]SOC32623.1 conserved protein of unknown function [Brochothrix thermosphacta]